MDLRGFFERLNRLPSVAGLGAARAGIPAMVALFAFEPVARWLGIHTGGAAGDFATLLFFGVAMLGFGYGYAEDAHVRIDIVSRRFPIRLRAAIELAGVTLVVAPFCVAIIAYGADSAWRSFQQGESLGDSGLALQWVVRALAPLGFALLLAAGLAGAIRALRLLMRREP